ncbi:BTAD domain-containing putative transcriptional regulator [Phytohabitans sp. ZYX-F-186]|uniref:BTAD domain-containing putative transcriptional regulator n=1 Tax=Phytohabitans maris TaxID=3071409 RepID=A0ABU0ZI62_9ACTN|nr:BTAD domain-containing putative transcriptional regulator [Phytohabitans sp. ZYX-F-186]MDQ7906062.1 BTAD domain-containing putative transcriptional regulator [Phytohabitans sp. ZYX-F-186]
MSAAAPPRLQILGPLRIWRDGVELAPGPRQQAYLLAVLLARAGEPISTSELIDLIWGDDAPESAVNILQKYVGALRRLLEPAVPARETGSYLQRHRNGYLFAADPDLVDVVTFRELVAAAKGGVAEQRPDAALDRYVRALGLWHGPAGEGLAHGSTAMAIFAALDGEFFDACVAAAELAVSRGQPERVLHALYLAARMAPLHEGVQASLVRTLAAAGRQAEALSVFQTVRARLAEELGIDPGPTLVAALRHVLARQPAEDIPAGTPAADALVGRAEELGVLRQAVASAFAGGTGLVVIEGEPGVGKTRLLEEAAAGAGRRGALVVWGRCLEGDGTPSMWPWVQAVGAILGGLPAPAREQWHASELGRLVGSHGGVPATPVLPDSGTRFRLFEQAVALVGTVSVRRPVVLFVDDLQWADTASLDLFSHLAARLPAGTAVIGALRDRAPVPGSELARMLAAASRVPRHRRIRLGPLGPDEVAELVRRETGQDPSPGAARSIHARTAGNPFFVRELSRLLADGGVLTVDAAARTAVPSTVRDVVRDRMAGLDDDARGLLQAAALIGRDVDLALLARTAGLDAQACLEGLEPLEELGLFEPSPGDPYSFRFPHDLVRESVAETTPPRRAARLHLLVADGLEGTAEDDEPVVERLAHHLWAAGPLADPARTAATLVRAGRCAAGKSALDAAARQLHTAAQVARTAGLVELELSALSLFTAVDGMRAGYVGSALDLLERAEHLARELGREREAADFLFSRWAAYSQGIQLDPAGRLARRLLEQGEASADPIVRAYGRHAWGIHQWDVGNVGEAFRYLSHASSTVLDDPAHGGEGQLRRDLRLLWPVMLALMTALHGDLDTARARLDTIEAAAGDDPYVITVWAAFAVTVEAVAGDPARTLRAAKRGIALDPEFSFAFLGSYQRLARCWARAVTGDDPAGAAAEAQEIITAALTDPPRSGLATWYGLLGEMWLAAGDLEEAATALDRADSFLHKYGQRYPEGLLLLLRARLMRARGEPVAAVRAAAERARALSVEREAHLFARRAEELLDGLA